MGRTTLGALSTAVILLVAACVAPVPPSASPSPRPIATPSGSTVTPTAVPALAPSPTPIVAPISEIEPVEGNVLPIAARNGAPGLISCGAIGPFRFEELKGPFGAEGLVGPEYDVLRDTIAQYGQPDDPEFAALARATYKVVSRDGSGSGVRWQRRKPGGPVHVGDSRIRWHQLELGGHGWGLYSGGGAREWLERRAVGHRPGIQGAD